MAVTVWTRYLAAEWLALAICVPSGTAWASHGSLSTTVGSYIVDESVTFSFSVPTGLGVVLPTDAPYEIRKEGRLVFAPRRSPKPKTVKVGEPAVWRWDQRDLGEKPAGPGTYQIVLLTRDDGRYEVSFEITTNGRAPLKERNRHVSKAAYAAVPLLSGAAAVAAVGGAPPAVKFLAFAEVAAWCVGWASDALADDPPDPNFRESVQLNNSEITMPAAIGPLEGAVQKFALSALSAFDLMSALRRSLEKKDGASAANAPEFASRHRSTAMEFAKRLGSATAQLREHIGGVSTELKMAGIVDVSQEVVEKYIAQGFLPEEMSALRKIGFTDADLARMRRILEGHRRGGSLLDSLSRLSANIAFLERPLEQLAAKGE